MILSELLLMTCFYMWYLRWLVVRKEHLQHDISVPKMMGANPPSVSDGIPDILHVKRIAAAIR